MANTSRPSLEGRVTENSDDHELQALETLEEHVARLEGTIQVILEEIEAGTILESAAGIREARQHRD